PVERLLPVISPTSRSHRPAERPALQLRSAVTLWDNSVPMRRVLFALLLLLVLLAPAAALAQEKSAAWDRYDVTLAIQPNGDVQVTETQALAFSGSFSHAFRTLGLSRSTGITDVQVSEPNQ